MVISLERLLVGGDASHEVIRESENKPAAPGVATVDPLVSDTTSTVPAGSARPSR
jgi:hypothetical protein